MPRKTRTFEGPRPNNVYRFNEAAARCRGKRSAARTRLNWRAGLQ